MNEGLSQIGPADRRHRPKFVVEHWVCLPGKGWLGPWPTWSNGKQTARMFARIAREDYGYEAMTVTALYPAYRAAPRPHAEPGELID